MTGARTREILIDVPPRLRLSDALPRLRLSPLARPAARRHSRALAYDGPVRQLVAPAMPMNALVCEQRLEATKPARECIGWIRGGERRRHRVDHGAPFT